MKHLLSLFIGIACCCCLQAQVLYGTATEGGTGYSGTITKLDLATKTLTTAYNIQDDGKLPKSQPVQASNGKFYGMTTDGASFLSSGVIYSFDPTTNAYALVYYFGHGGIGYNPQGSLIQAKDGKLYGMSGGSSNGVIFSFDPATNIVAKVKGFTGTDGASPQGSLLQASDGKLYGMTRGGGVAGLGVIFSFDPATNTYLRLYDFGRFAGSGVYPQGSLIQAKDGKFYGMTTYSTNNGPGVIFSFDPVNNTCTQVYTFNVTDGANPQGSLLQASDGKLYGTASSGGSANDGVVFSINPSTNVYSKLKDFSGSDGANPYGSLIQTPDGKLYGTASNGGSTNNGVVFSFDPSTSTYTKLKDFSGSDGANPQGSFMQASNGKLYSVTYAGGVSKDGVLFSFDPVTSTYTGLHVFEKESNGNTPNGGLMKATDGKLFGMTQAGGWRNDGSIFSFNPSTGIATTLYSFDHLKGDGASPYGTLIQASDGKFYGMTIQGGSHNYGVIFSVDPATGTYTNLKEFDGSGYFPIGSLLQASNGKLYGMTNRGGAGIGCIFSFDLATHTYIILQNFGAGGVYGTLGGSPSGSLIQASDGLLYGMTAGGGGKANDGVIFSIDPATNAYTVRKVFKGTNGAQPTGDLIQARNGKLYGMTYIGGSNNTGVIFSFNPVTNAYTKLKDFDSANGANPYGSLMQASDGKLYGMTYNGGSNNGGVAFSYDPATGVYSKLADFTSATGVHPLYTSFVEDQTGGGTTLPKVRISNDTLFEGNSGQQAMTFTVSLSVKPIKTVTVNYNTIDRTANAPSDYIAQSGTLTFAPGEKTKTISVLINGDNTKERDETFAVALHNAVNATLKDSIGVGVIRNDDGTMLTSGRDISILPNLANRIEQNVTVFPNPASSLVQVKLGGYRGKVTLQLTDMAGKVLREATAQSADTKSAQQTQFNVADLASGTYFIEVLQGTSHKTVKMIKR